MERISRRAERHRGAARRERQAIRFRDVDEWGRPTTVEELTELIAKVPMADDPYEVGWEVWGGAMGVIGSSEPAEVAHGLWLLWGGLTDWVERKPDETAEAHEAMRRAAADWAAVKDDPPARDAYFGYWLYEVIGYERPM